MRQCGTITYFAFIFGFALVSSIPKQSYLILSPKVFWPGTSLTLKVTILKSSSPVNIVASIISGYRHEKSKLIVSNNKDFNVGKTSDLEIKVPPGLTSGGYRLVVNGTGGLSFHNESYITLRSKGMAIYVQMDKGVYKPGQTVQMRIFALMPNLHSYTGKMTVDILDPNESKMAHWPEIKGLNGIIKKDFPLSSQPVMGEWKVNVVAANGEKFSKTFEVKEYVLPKFDVSVTLPPYVLQEEKSVLVDIASKYTYGKGVKGKALVRGYFSNWRKEVDCFIKKHDIDGSLVIKILMEEIKDCFKRTYSFAKSDKDVENQLFKYSWYQFLINATVVEDLTGKSYSEKAQVRFSNSKVKLEFPSFNPSTFKPGLEFVTLLKVTKPDGEPFLDKELLRKIKVTIKTTYTTSNRYSHMIQEEEAYTPSDEGVIIIRRKSSGKNSTGISMVATYMTDNGYPVTAYFSAYKSESPSASYLQMTTSTPSVKSGDKIDFKVNSSFAVSSYTYVIMARGKIREIESASANNAKLFGLSITSSHVMAPSAEVILYTIRKDGEVVVDSLSITVENPFENEVSVKFSREKSRPGEQIGLVAKASPGSSVAFLVVDKSVLLMKKDNDISRDQVLQDLQAYNAGSSWYPWWTWSWFTPARPSRHMIMPFPTSGRDAMSVFENAGLLIFSDCLVYKKYTYDRGPYPVYESAVDVAPASGGVLRKTSTTSRGGKQPLAEIRIRSLFPETWIWKDFNASSSGQAEMSVAVPDTITSWVASAFAISPQSGFGISSIKPKLQVFQPFFVSLDLPYSVVRGEEVAIKALVFNYQENAQVVTITFKASPDFQAIDEFDTSGKYAREAVDITEELTIPAGVGRAVAFPIIPKTLGHVPIIVQAQSSSNADAVKRTILVEPEGVPNSYSYSILIDLNTTSSFTKTLELALPKSAVPGSAHAKVTVIGDILGSSFSNLDNLLRMPYGCGEQNMVNFAPNIFILKYLTAVNQVTPVIRSKAENYMVTGYQREQTYRHKDGAYSAFGERDREGSMWLTAFVVKSYAQARKYIYVDPESLKLSLNYMARKQNKDGSFPTLGKVHGSYLKGGNDGKVSLSAFVVVALAEAASTDLAVMLAKQEGIRYLETNLDSIITKKDVYGLSLTAYALALVNSAHRHKARDALLAMAINKDGMTHWSNAKDDSDQPILYRPYYRPRSADVEITAYALLTLGLNKDIKNGLPVVRWLSVQRNSFGGFASTQDTVLGIQAMSEFASLVYSSSLNFEVKLKQTAEKGFSETFTVNNKNSMVLQQALITKVEGSLEISAKGRGIGMVQVGVTYHVEKVPDKSDFKFLIEMLNEENYEFETKSCATWKGVGDESDMAVMELGVASGFTPNQDSIDKLLKAKDLFVKRIEKETKKVVLYFDKISKKEATCVVMKYERTHPVGKSQPVPAIVYDYYNPELRAEALYSSGKLSKSSVCRVCAMCKQCDFKVEPTQGKSQSFCPRLAADLALVMIAAIFTLFARY